MGSGEESGLQRRGKERGVDQGSLVSWPRVTCRTQKRRFLGLTPRILIQCWWGWGVQSSTLQRPRDPEEQSNLGTTIEAQGERCHPLRPGRRWAIP